MIEPLTDTSQIAAKFCLFTGAGSFGDLRIVALTSKWSIALDDDLDLIEVHDRSRRVGWMLGVVIDLRSGSVLHDPLHLETERAEDAWSEICDRCAGSWLYVSERGEEIELRPDADATVGVVFEPATKRAASHAFLLTGEDFTARLEEADRAANQVERDGWFTAGLTAHEGIYRLLPNHALHTANFEQKRLAFDLPGYAESIEEILDAMESEIRTVVTALANDRATKVCLTGGTETRALLASLRPDAGATHFVTIDFENSLDAMVSTRLANRFGLNHAILKPVKASAEEQQAWRVGAGLAMAGANMEFFPSLRPLAGQYLVGGLGGEFGRGFLWPENLEAGHPMSTELILARLKQPGNQKNLEAVDQWRTKLPHGLDAFQILDLAYLELRMGPWAFAQPRFKWSPRSIHPLISYRQFRRMLAVPPHIKHGDRLFRSMIDRHWPELLEVPINKYGDWRDLKLKVARALARPDRVIRKARQVLSTAAGRAG